MRTKKTNIKEGKITRTITRTYVEFLTFDSATREVKESKKFLNLAYTADEAEAALREMGFKVVEVTYVDPIECKYEISVSRFIECATPIED